MKIALILLSRGKYAWRILWGGYLLAIAAFAMLIAAVSLMALKQMPFLGFFGVKIAIISVLPLLSIALSAALFAEDFSEGTFAHHLSYPYSQLLVFIERITVVALLIVVYEAALLWAIDRWVFALSSPQLAYLIKHSLSVHLFVGALAALGSLLGRNMAVGLGAGAAVWLLEYLMSGVLHNRYSLFQAVWRVNQFADPAHNAIALFGAAATLLCCCLLLLGKGRGWLVRKP
jgi:ABC-type transport system involved in multi-copper enzyme maturation permease subunit